MAIKDWIARDYQNAVVNKEIKKWTEITARQYGVRSNQENPGFAAEVGAETFLRTLPIRLDLWNGSSTEQLDIVGKAEETDIRKGDRFRIKTRQGRSYWLVVNRVTFFGDTVELGLKYS